MFKQIAVGTALAAVSVLAVVAQPAPNTPPVPGTTQQQQQPLTAPGTGSGMGTTGTTGAVGGTANQGGLSGALQFGTAQTDDQWLGSNFVNRSVYTQDGTDIGDINDMVIDRNGMVQAVIIGVGGFLGIGEKDVAIPFNALQIMRDANASTADNSVRITVRASRAELENAPAFREYDWRGGNTAPGTTGTTNRGTGTGMGTGTGTGTGTNQVPAR
jgi:sporulation protein YlmC with PRC-barrel domain